MKHFAGSTVDKPKSKCDTGDQCVSHCGHMSGKRLRQNGLYSSLLCELLTRLVHLLDLTGE